MKTFDLQKYLSYEFAVTVLALSFCIGPLTASLSELLHFYYSSLYTAATMYLPLLFSLTVFAAINHKAGEPLLNAKGVILLGFLCGFWLINYFYEINHVSRSSLSVYDGKRMWFFVHGVLLSGLIGLHAPKDPRRFIRRFLISFCIISTTASLSYLLTYRPGESFERLLGERALGAGLVGCYGVASCLSLLYLHMTDGPRFSGRLLVALTGAILIDVAAIALSATRGAALCALASVIVFAWMARRSKPLLPTVAFLVLPFICLVPVVKPYMPEATMKRLMMQEHGFGLRFELSRTMLDLLIEHPCGRVLGYENTKLRMDYSHNAFLQYVGEAGLLQTTPVLLVLLYGVARNLVRHRADLHVRALALFGLPVLIESFSAGSAYDSLLWFLLFFLFSLRRDPQGATQSSYAMGSAYAATPAWNAA